jgi:hypothetical protein
MQKGVRRAPLLPAAARGLPYPIEDKILVLLTERRYP